jgi:hypothetical protein
MRWHADGLEFMYTLRGATDAELHQRLGAIVPKLRAIVTGLAAQAVPPAPVPWDPEALSTRHTPPPTEAEVPEDWCARHEVTMERRTNAQGSWYSHRLSDGTYCKGK